MPFVSKEDMKQFLNEMLRNNEEERMAALVGYNLAGKADDILVAILNLIEDKPEAPQITMREAFTELP